MDLVWYVFAAAFLVLEALGIWTVLPTLTEWWVRHVPGWFSLVLWLWLGVHFASRYLGHPILRP